MSPNPNPSSNSFYLVSLVLICLGTIAGLVLLAMPSRKPAGIPNAELEAQKQTIANLQKELDDLQKSSVASLKAGTPSDAAFTAGLMQHEKILSEIRNELGHVNDEAKAAKAAVVEAQETDKRTREAATTFLGVFAIIAGLLAGQGYLKISEWEKDAQKKLDDALKVVDEKKADITSGLQKINDAGPQLTLIRETQESLETTLPLFLESERTKVLQNEQKNPSATKQGDLVRIDEIDHLTYLANPAIRFQKNRSPKEAEEYLQTLLLVGRGHFARGNHDEAISRLDEYFTVLNQNPGMKPDDEDMGRAYAYRAFAHYHLLRRRRTAPSWLYIANQESARQLWSAAMNDALKSEKTAPSLSLFVQALLYSREYVLEWDLTDLNVQRRNEATKRYIKGQREAVKRYEDMLQKQLKFWPVPINLACCLKRIADYSVNAADYQTFKDKLDGYSAETELEVALKSGPGDDVENRFLWQNMMADSDLFGKLNNIDIKDYTAFWTALLDKKMNVRKWRADLSEIRRLNPNANSWEVRL